MTTKDVIKKLKVKAGDILVGSDRGGECRIQVTAVGINLVLAKCLTHKEDKESSWSLEHRDWKKEVDHKTGRFQTLLAKLKGI